ncbi:MAG: hypothetical protein JHC33_09750 [Ignisphaera sp.]|nr:hypothetical protein [Ignisphaera sp.]
MAAVDRKREGKYNQKRGVSVLTIPFVESQVIGDGSVFATLPANSVVIFANLTVTTPSGTSKATIQPVINGSNYGSALDVTVAGSANVNTPVYLATGGNVVVTPGATAPADGALVGILQVIYIENDKVTGEYTN